MEIDLQKFRDEGCLILENVVPPKKLQDLKQTVELMVDREKTSSVAECKDGDRRGGNGYQTAQPRIELNSITAETAFIHCGALC